MEIVGLTVWIINRLAVTVGLGLILGFWLGIWYAPSYYDASECDGRRKWSWLQKAMAQNCIVTLLRNHYFNHTLVYTDTDGEVKPVSDAYYARLSDNNETVIFAGHPHGLFAISSLLLVGLPSVRPSRIDSHLWKRTTESADDDDNGKQKDTMAKPSSHWSNVRPCVHRHLFSIPLLRDLALWLGAIDVSRENITRTLKTHSVYLSPGGCREMIIDGDSTAQRRHTGFLRLAYAERKLVYPVLHHGQARAFRSYSCAWLDRVRHIVLDLTGYPFPSFFLGPFPTTLTTHILAPHDPAAYETEDAFVNGYLAVLQRNVVVK